MAKPKNKRKPLYGKQREKAEDQLWDISQNLNKVYDIHQAIMYQRNSK